MLKNVQENKTYGTEGAFTLFVYGMRCVRTTFKEVFSLLHSAKGNASE